MPIPPRATRTLRDAFPRRHPEMNHGVRCGLTMLRKQVSGPLDSLDSLSWPDELISRGLSDMARAERTGRFDCQGNAASCAKVGWPRGVPRAADDPSRRPVCRCFANGRFVHKLAARTESAGASIHARLELGATGFVVFGQGCPNHERRDDPAGVEVVRGRHRSALPGHGSIEMPPAPPCHGGLREDVD